MRRALIWIAVVGMLSGCRKSADPPPVSETAGPVAREAVKAPSAPPGAGTPGKKTPRVATEKAAPERTVEPDPSIARKQLDAAKRAKKEWLASARKLLGIIRQEIDATTASINAGREEISSGKARLGTMSFGDQNRAAMLLQMARANPAGMSDAMLVELHEFLPTLEVERIISGEAKRRPPDGPLAAMRLPALERLRQHEELTQRLAEEEKAARAETEANKEKAEAILRELIEQHPNYAEAKEAARLLRDLERGCDSPEK